MPEGIATSDRAAAASPGLAPAPPLTISALSMPVLDAVSDPDLDVMSLPDLDVMSSADLAVMAESAVAALWPGAGVPEVVGCSGLPGELRGSSACCAAFAPALC